MIRLILTIMVLVSFAKADCDTFYRQKGEATSIEFELRTLDDVDEVIGASQEHDSECQISKDGSTSSNISNSFEHFALGFYRINLTSSEVNSKTSLIRCKNNDNYRTKCLRIETYGDTSTNHPVLFHQEFPETPTPNTFADFISKGINKTLSCKLEKEAQ